MSKLGLFRGFSRVIILFIWPYSCWFCRMCWAYADWELLFVMYLMFFLEMYAQVMARLANI